MMISATGNSRPSSEPDGSPSGFTLVELVLVMALLTVGLAYTAPSLSRFFRGRNLDSEARRFLALTRYGQSRAVSEGVPMLLWMNTKLGTYGLGAQVEYADRDRRAAEYAVAEGLEMAVQMPILELQTNFWNLTPQFKPNQPAICFLPDGFMSETSANTIQIRQVKNNDAVWIVQTTNRLAYEIQVQPPLPYRR
jgi:type II secretion system protein H